jgi:hypothetical protein
MSVARMETPHHRHGARRGPTRATGEPACVTSWLLEGPAFVRYRTLVDIIGCPGEGNEARQARAAVARDPSVKQLLDRRNEDGYWGSPRDIFTWWPKRDTTFWVLGVLADFGLTRSDPRISRACEYVLSTQLPCGAFGPGTTPTAYDCFTGVLASALARHGYCEDERLDRAYAWLSARQRIDGGFWCKNTAQPGGPRELEPSCALASLWVLSALTAHPMLDTSKACLDCADFLLGCWENRGTIKYAGHDSQIGTGWERLKYPFTDYRILHYLETLSRVPAIRGDPRVALIADLLLSKCDARSRFRPESIHKAWASFDFGQKKDASRWLTCLAHGTLTRLGRSASACPARTGASHPRL